MLLMNVWEPSCCLWAAPELLSIVKGLPLKRQPLLYTEYFCLPRIRLLRPNPQCDGLRSWSLWEVIRL